MIKQAVPGQEKWRDSTYDAGELEQSQDGWKALSARCFVFVHELEDGINEDGNDDEWRSHIVT